MTDRFAEALRVIAEEVLQRDNLDDRTVQSISERLKSLIGRVRTLDETLFADLPPAFQYQLNHGSYDVDGMAGYEDAIAASARGSGSGYAAPVTSLAQAQPAGDPAQEDAAGHTVIADDELGRLSLSEQLAALERGDVTAVELVERAIAQARTLDPHLQAFIVITEEQALADAREADRRRGTNAARPLDGVPIAYKDLFDIRGLPTTAAAAFLGDRVATRDCTVVARLRAAGAVSIGKNNLHQFAFGSTSESTHLGPIRNPLDRRRSPAGSSGGSAAAVAARIVAMSMGTDTGGSIRMPAAACGIFGIKPTYGRVSKAGVLPLSWSLDHPGPLSATVEDSARILAIIAGYDPEDPSTVPVPVDDYVAAAQQGAREGVKGLRIGVLADWIDDRVDPGVAQALQDAVAALRQAGAQVADVTLLPVNHMTLVNRLIILGEAGAVHAGLLDKHAGDYNEDVRARLELGQFILARDYLLGQRLRTELTRRTNRALQQVDVLLSPTLPIGAPWVGQQVVSWPSGDEALPDTMIRMTAPFNVTGHPVASVPFGRASNGMPAAVQIVGRAFDEATVLRVSAALERAQR